MDIKTEAVTIYWKTLWPQETLVINPFHIIDCIVYMSNLFASYNPPKMFNDLPLANWNSFVLDNSSQRWEIIYLVPIDGETDL